MTKLKKTHVEALLRDYDSDPIGALTAALRVVLDQPNANWLVLLSAAILSDNRLQRLQDGEQAALDELAAELNETRDLAR